MTITRVYNQVEDLLQRLREQLVLLITGAYGLYLLVYTLIVQPEFPSGFHDGRYWGGILALTFAVASQLGVLRNIQKSIFLFIPLIPLVIAQTYRLLYIDASPAELLLWMAVIITSLYMILGSRIANVFVLVLLTGMVSVVLGNLPHAHDGHHTHAQSQHLQAEWWSGGLVLGLLAFISARITIFVERNLLMHEQSTYQLEAARLDALTKAYGRAAIEEEMQYAIENADTHGVPLSIIVTDIDHFKKVNDKHGHNMGDEVLRSFVRRMKRRIGNNGGIIGRWGGEEFVVLLPGMARPDARALAESLRKTVAASPIRGLPITASFGVSSLRKENDDLEQLFARADEKLYDAKIAGRNLVR